MNTYLPKLIATILKEFREQLKENDQLNAVEEIAGPAPEIPLEYDQILKGGRFWDDVNGGYLPEDVVLAARREEIDWVHSEGVYEIVPMQECRDAGMKTVGLDLGGRRQVCGSDTQENSIEVVCKRKTITKKQGKIQRALSASQLFSGMPPLEAVQVLVSNMMSVSLSDRGKPLKLRHYDISRAYFQGTARDSLTSNFPAEDRQKYGEDKVGGLIKSMCGTQDASHTWQLDYVNLICRELGGFRRGKHSAALFHNPTQDVTMAVHGDDFVCLSDDDGLKHIDSLLKSKYTAKDMETLGFEDSDVTRFLFLNRVFIVGVYQTGQYLDVELYLRHAPLIIGESGCNENTEAVSTPPEKLQDKLVLDGRRSPILKKYDDTYLLA